MYVKLFESLNFYILSRNKVIVRFKFIIFARVEHFLFK